MATSHRPHSFRLTCMLLAVVATLFVQQILTPAEMIIGLVVGGGIGALLAKRVEMTGMPELVAAFNGFGGIASALVAGAEVARMLAANETMAAADSVTISLSVLIGLVTFTGSFVAFGKLSGRISGNPILFPGLRVLTLLFAVAAVGGIV